MSRRLASNDARGRDATCHRAGAHKLIISSVYPHFLCMFKSPMATPEGIGPEGVEYVQVWPGGQVWASADVV